MWRSVFLHEFPRGSARVFNGLPGHATPSSLAVHCDAMLPGEQFHYHLDEPLDDVIGYSGRLRVRRPSTSPEQIRLITAGADVEFRVQQDGARRADLSSRARGLLRVGSGPLVDIGTLIFPYREYVDIRFDWHTSGQARLLQGEKLVGYHNAVAPGAVLSIGDVSVGRTEVPLGTAGTPIGVQRIFVRALRQQDALAIFSKFLPETVYNDDPQLARCRTVAIQQLFAASAAIRPLMAQFHQQESEPWSSGSNASSPFSAAATTAHEQALEAGAALMRMLRTKDFSASASFLDPFETFLRTLKQALPAQFDALAQQFLSDESHPRCRQLLSQDRAENGAAAEPILELFGTASKVILKVVGS